MWLGFRARGSEADETSRKPGRFLGGGYVRRFRLVSVGGIRGCSRPPGSLVSPWERGGRLCIRLVESESRVQDDRRTSRPTGKSL